MNTLVNSKIKPQKAIDTTFCGFIDMEIFKIFCALSRFLTMQILPGLRHRMRKAKMEPMMAQIQRICRAVVRPHWSAPQPTRGETRPPMVVVKPKVTPEAKPTFFPEVGLS